MPNVTGATSFFPRAVEGFVTTLANTISAGATTLTANSTAGYSVGDPIVWIIDPATSAKQVLTGTVAAGNQIINVVWTYGTNQTHTAGATIVDYTTATGFDLVTVGILKHANQDGSLLQSPVLTAIGTGGITATQLATNSVTAPKLATNAILLGSTTITSTFSTSSGSAVQVTGLTLTVTVPAGGRSVKISFVCDSIFNDTAQRTTTVSLWDGTVGSGTKLATATAQAATSTGNQQIPASIISIQTPAAGSKTYNIGLQVGGGSGNSSLFAASGSPALLLVEMV